LKTRIEKKTATGNKWKLTCRNCFNGLRNLKTWTEKKTATGNKWKPTCRNCFNALRNLKPRIEKKAATGNTGKPTCRNGFKKNTAIKEHEATVHRLCEEHRINCTETRFELESAIQLITELENKDREKDCYREKVAANLQDKMTRKSGISPL
jgi:hypothetical protein